MYCIIWRGAGLCRNDDELTSINGSLTELMGYEDRREENQVMSEMIPQFATGSGM